MRRAIALALLALAATANDTLVHESAGNLIFVHSAAVAIQRERLVIGPPVGMPLGYSRTEWTIPFHVEYELENLAGSSISADVGFPLPACTLDEYAFETHRQYIGDYDRAATCLKEPEMKLSVAGASTPGRWQFVFLRNSSPVEDPRLSAEVSAMLALIKDPGQIYYLDDKAYLDAASRVCARLGGTMNGAECAEFKKVLVHRTFVWHHTFAPHNRTRVEHDYRVKASGNFHPEGLFASDVFCLDDPSTRTAWKNYRASLERETQVANRTMGAISPYPREFFTEYVLHTGANWAGPIKDFELVIRKSAPDQMVSTCFSGLTKVSPVEFRAHRTNFRPSEDLRILYLPKN